MLNPRLHNICDYVGSWCHEHKIPYSVVRDERDLQGMLLPRKNRPLINSLLTDLEPMLQAEGIHLETTKVRGGVILAFSVSAISETQLAALVVAAKEEREPMDFTEKITDAFMRTVAPIAPDVDLNEGTFLAAALKVAAESQYKTATRGTTRSNQTSLQRQRIGSDNTYSGHQDSPLASGGSQSSSPGAKPRMTRPAKGPPARFEDRIAGAFSLDYHPRRRKFYKELTEALDGMATPTGAQPEDLFTKFAKSLQVLGQSMGTGPLQDQLKKQGINWKKSEDGQSIFLYIVNAQTNAPQPIARISAATLEKPTDFEAQLLNIMDFAKGDAPGTFKQKQQELQQQEKAAREIAKQLGPQDPEAVAVQMGQQQPGLQGMAMPGPAAPAPQAAAQQAASPKPDQVGPTTTAKPAQPTPPTTPLG